MSVAPGPAVMAAMFEPEITEATGPNGKHDPNRAAMRQGGGRGLVAWERAPGGGGSAAGAHRRRYEVPPESCTHGAAEDVLTRVVMEPMAAGVATRRRERVAEPVGILADKEAKSTGRSVISRWFVKRAGTAPSELAARDLAGEDITVLMLDGEHMAEARVVVAPAITAHGTTKPVEQGRWRASVLPVHGVFHRDGAP